MKKLVALILVLLGLLSQSFLGMSRHSHLYPILDISGTQLPRNLRTPQQVLRGKSHLNLHGLQHLKISGSGQFSEQTFAEMIEHLSVSPQQMLVLDLREESHGFINGNAISWTDGNYNEGNLHKTKSEIEADEDQRLKFAVQSRKIVIDPMVEATKLTVYAVKTERDLVESYGATYVRLPVTDHHRPTDEVIDQFIELVKNLPSDQWMHFHCKAGKGRTTTFLALFDMMKNAKYVTLQDILARQQLIGGSDLLGAVSKQDDIKKRAAHDRLEFIQQFYLYCQRVPDFQVSWSDWLEEQHEMLCANHP